MTRESSFALDAAKEITIARVSNATVSPNKEGGENVAEFFEAIYNKVLELAKSGQE